MIPGRYEPYVRLPYAPDGRSRDGIDCYGLVHLVYRDLYGIELPEYAAATGGRDVYDLGAAELDELMALWMGEQSRWIEVYRREPPRGAIELAREGDVLERRKGLGRPHVLLIVSRDRALDVTKSGVAPVFYRSRDWQRRSKAIWRHPALA